MIKSTELNHNLTKPMLVCVFCKGTGKAIYIDINDKKILNGVVDLNKYGKYDKCPDCNGNKLNVC